MTNVQHLPSLRNSLLINYNDSCKIDKIRFRIEKRFRETELKDFGRLSAQEFAPMIFRMIYAHGCNKIYIILLYTSCSQMAERTFVNLWDASEKAQVLLSKARGPCTVGVPRAYSFSIFFPFIYSSDSISFDLSTEVFKLKSQIHIQMKILQISL